MRTDTQTLIDALRILARDIESDDSVANACIFEGADRLEQLRKAINNLIGYAITARSHSREWLVDMASYINLAAEAIDDPDRAVLAEDGEHLTVRKAVA
jgi:hypothetical protein